MLKPELLQAYSVLNYQNYISELYEAKLIEWCRDRFPSFEFGHTILNNGGSRAVCSGANFILSFAACYSLNRDSFAKIGDSLNIAQKEVLFLHSYHFAESTIKARGEGSLSIMLDLNSTAYLPPVEPHKRRLFLSLVDQIEIIDRELKAMDFFKALSFFEKKHNVDPSLRNCSKFVTGYCDYVLNLQFNYFFSELAAYLQRAGESKLDYIFSSYVGLSSSVDSNCPLTESLLNRLEEFDSFEFSRESFLQESWVFEE